MSYRNPAIIKDDSGLIVPNAIAQGMQTVAKGYKEGLAREEKIRRDNALSNARRSAQNLKEADRIAAQEVSITKGTEKLGNELGTSTERVRRQLIEKNNYNRNIIKNPQSTDKEKDEAKIRYAESFSQLQEVNTFVEKYTLDHAEANDRLNSPNDGTYEYVRSDEEDDENAGDYSQKISYSLGAINGSGISVKFENNTLSMVGHGAKDSGFGYEKTLKEYNSSGFKITIPITNVVAEANTNLDATITNSDDPSQLGGKFSNGVLPYSKRVVGEDGKVWITTVEEINKDEFDKAYKYQVDMIVAGIQELPFQNKNSNLRRMGLDHVEYNRLMSDTSETSSESKAKATEMLRSHLDKNLYKGSAQKIQRDVDGNWTRRTAAKEFVPEDVAVLDVDERYSYVTDLLKGYDGKGITKDTFKLSNKTPIKDASGWYVPNSITMEGSNLVIYKKAPKTELSETGLDQVEIEDKNNKLVYSLKDESSVRDLIVNLFGVSQYAAAKEAKKLFKANSDNTSEPVSGAVGSESNPELFRTQN
jgi:ribosomal protein L6P/L9E